MARLARHRWLKAMLLVCGANLGWQVYSSATRPERGEMPSKRNNDFPNTYINRIHLDLTGPNSYVTLTWAGERAAEQNVGPFHSSAGIGWGSNDCNDPVESNCPDSRCTPKGLRKVEGLADHMREGRAYRYVTWVDRRRAIGFHAHATVPAYPASQGCIRLEPYAARLIHDNSIVGKTEILIDGTWTNPRAAGSEGQEAGSHPEGARQGLDGEYAEAE